jgi:nucleotide-binding universal stress UspA family protein
MEFVAGLGRYDIGEVVLANVTRMTGVEAPVAERRELDRGKMIADLASILTNAGVNVSAVPLAGAPHEEILRAAHDGHVSLIVTGTRAKSALSEFMVGSVSETVGRKSKTPVLMVPYRMLAELPDDKATYEAGRTLLDSVVFPTDFSDVSERVLDLIKGLEGPEIGGVTVAHIVDPRELPTESQRQAALRSDRRILAAICDELAERGIDGQCSLVVGPVVAELLELAESKDATCFIIGSHGRGISEEVFVGSVSQNVIRMSGRPVLITH